MRAKGRDSTTGALEGSELDVEEDAAGGGGREEVGASEGAPGVMSIVSIVDGGLIVG